MLRPMRIRVDHPVFGTALLVLIGLLVALGCSDSQTSAPRAGTEVEQKKSGKKVTKKEDNACASLDGSYHERVDHCEEGDDAVTSTKTGSNTGTGTSTGQSTAKGSSTATSSGTGTGTGSSSGSATSTATATGTGTGTGTAVALNIVTFQITAGTGTRDWNTVATAVNAKVGQTLRITNMDTVPHRLHTGGVPCPHQPAVMNQGQSYDCILTQAIDTTAGGASATYDHQRAAGETRNFFIKITN